MKPITTFFILIALSLILSYILPWWFLFVASFTAGLFSSSKQLKNFLIGFVGGLLLWGSYSLYIYIYSEGKLTSKIAQLLTLPNPLLLVLITSVLGGLIAGISLVIGNLIINTLLAHKKISIDNKNTW